MLWTILVVLCVLWLLGVVTSYTLGGFIHILLLVALAIFVINLIQGRRRMGYCWLFWVGWRSLIRDSLIPIKKESSMLGRSTLPGKIVSEFRFHR
jgi:uncharacterized membrane protein